MGRGWRHRMGKPSTRGLQMGRSSELSVGSSKQGFRASVRTFVLWGARVRPAFTGPVGHAVTPEATGQEDESSSPSTPSPSTSGSSVSRACEISRFWSSSNFLLSYKVTYSHCEKVPWNESQNKSNAILSQERTLLWTLESVSLICFLYTYAHMSEQI